MLPSITKRISKSLEEEIKGFQNRLKEMNGFEISFVKASDLYGKVNKDTIWRLTKKLKLPL